MTRKRLALWAAILIALLTVFAAYLKPGLAYTLAIQLLIC